MILAKDRPKTSPSNVIIRNGEPVDLFFASKEYFDSIFNYPAEYTKFTMELASIRQAIRLFNQQEGMVCSDNAIEICLTSMMIDIWLKKKYPELKIENVEQEKKQNVNSLVG